MGISPRRQVDKVGMAFRTDSCNLTLCFAFQLCFVSEQPTNDPSFSRTSISNPPLPLNQRPILSQTKKKQTNFSIFVVSREWPGHQVLLVLTDFFNFSRNDVTGRACRGASTGVSPPRWAHFSQKKNQMMRKSSTCKAC